MTRSATVSPLINRPLESVTVTGETTSGTVLLNCAEAASAVSSSRQAKRIAGGKAGFGPFGHYMSAFRLKPGQFLETPQTLVCLFGSLQLSNLSMVLDQARNDLVLALLPACASILRKPFHRSERAVWDHARDTRLNPFSALRKIANGTSSCNYLGGRICLRSWVILSPACTSTVTRPSL
jgi:hypothetical protein